MGKGGGGADKDEMLNFIFSPLTFYFAQPPLHVECIPFSTILFTERDQGESKEELP